MYTFIVNPHARSGLGQKVWNELETILKKENVDYQVFYTKYQKHATKLTSEITSDGEEHIVIALGGDGTVNEVVNGIHNFDKTIFGYIPIGSGNDFARGLQLPKEPEAALRTILNCPNLYSMNIGELHYKEKKRRFAVSAGFGFDADICHEVVVSRLKYILNRLKLGKLTYVFTALHRLFVIKPCSVTVTIDDGKPRTFPKTYFVAMMNNKYEGGGVKFCPKAKNNDNKLDILVASNVSKVKVLCLLPLALFGLHTHFKGVYIFTCKNVKVHAENALPLHTDGEPVFFQHNISANCAAKKLRIITSEKLW